MASYIQAGCQLGQWRTAYIISLASTLCVFAGCFRFTDELLPEAGEIIKKSAYIKNDMIKLKLLNLKKRVRLLIDKINAS